MFSKFSTKQFAKVYAREKKMLLVCLIIWSETYTLFIFVLLRGLYWVVEKALARNYIYIFSS